MHTITNLSPTRQMIYDLTLEGLTVLLISYYSKVPLGKIEAALYQNENDPAVYEKLQAVLASHRKEMTCRRLQTLSEKIQSDIHYFFPDIERPFDSPIPF